MGEQDSKRPLTYKAAGVDIEAGDALVEGIKPLAASTRRPGVMQNLGGFAAAFDLKAAGFKDPVVLSGTDGVGTKLIIAEKTGDHTTIGIDLVAMCVNDLVVHGAAPMFFLDYFATGHLEVSTAQTVIAGIAEGCRQAGCALVGGETAEMPDMYAPGTYDLAGFAVGAVERDEMLPRSDLAAGDVVIGIASSGFHSNGYSLLRKIVDRSGLGYDSPAPFDPSTTVGQALLTPTRIYINTCMAAMKAGGVKAFCHITGGGLTENIPRVLSDDIAMHIDLARADQPAMFRWAAEIAELPADEMLKTFNCGIGMVVVVEAASAETVLSAIRAQGDKADVIGEIRSRDGAEPVTYDIPAGWPC
jgi:phosphoribosylformylglycinamidine cyclo-ligase